MKKCDEMCFPIGRRAFLQNSTLLLAATATSSILTANETVEPLRIGLVTDLHHADKPATRTRYYRETVGKLNEAAIQFKKANTNSIVELGDLIDAADSVETEQRYLKTINREFSAISQDRHYVLGNHCVDTLTKAEFLGTEFVDFHKPKIVRCRSHSRAAHRFRCRNPGISRSESFSPP